MSPGHLSVAGPYAESILPASQVFDDLASGYAADVSPMWRDAAENSVGQVVMPYRVKMAGPRGNVFT
jgi:hypothetical protein